MQLYLVRHAQSENNANIDRPAPHHPDPPLTDLGAQQARHLGHYLGTADEPDRRSDTFAWRDGQQATLGYHFDQIITSPMLRALQTAKPIAAASNAPVTVWPDVCERGGMFRRQAGPMNGLPGLTRAQIRASFPAYELPPRIGRHGWWQGNRETDHASYRRAASIAARLHQQATSLWRGAGVLVVSHAGFLDLLVKAVLAHGLPDPPPSQHIYYFYNTALSRLDFMPAGQVSIRYTNRLPHLPDDLIS